MATPLQPRQFFQGIWTGNGELIPNRFLRWLLPVEAIHMTSEAVWLSDTVWLVKDRFEFSSGRTIDREMFATLVAPDRVHVTADDMPLGADIHLSEDGFRFTPYLIIVQHRGVTFRLRCRDECVLDSDGRIHDVVRMSFRGVPVATMRLGPILRSTGVPC